MMNRACLIGFSAICLAMTCAFIGCRCETQKKIVAPVPATKGDAPSAEGGPSAQVAPDHDVSVRKRLVVSRTAADPAVLNQLRKASGRKPGQLNGKHVLPMAAAVLQIHHDNKDAKKVILVSAPYRHEEQMFTKIRAAQAFLHFRDVFTQDEVLRIEKAMATYPGFFGYGTENHIAMRRISGLLFGQSFPDAKFSHGLLGRQVAQECTAYMQRYGRAVYGGSNSEFLSHVYFPVHMEAWADAWQYARDPVARLMAQAMLDWFFSNAALNFQHGFVNGPIHRGSYGGIDKFRKHALSRLLWMYGADTGETLEEVSKAQMPASVIALALTEHMPQEAIRSLLSKRVRLPYSIRQACANTGYISGFCENKVVPRKASFRFPYAKSLFRTVYVHENYAMGGGNLRITREEFSAVPTSIAFTASWRSTHPQNYLLVAHPYWFTKKKWGKEEAKWGFGEKMGSKEQTGETYVMDHDPFGFSPCLQTVQQENAAVLFYHIPKTDPLKDYHPKGGSASERLEQLIQEVFVYIPRSVDQRERTSHGFFVRAGNAYAALLPFSAEAKWKESARRDFVRIGIPGEFTGLAVEMGDRNEYGSFEDFMSRFDRSRLDLSGIRTGRTVRYVSTRGHVLTIRHTGFGTGLPESSINGTPVSFDTYPVIESPYLSSADYVLDVNDGSQGFTVDWRSDYPAYAYYRLEGGTRTRSVYRRVWVENGTVKDVSAIHEDPHQ